ncbi:MAG: ADP-ribosylglycohydrolase family protein [Planctomycetaceae bacterium]|nr:ADP-ribosylglycohydrolase family protein [Planctomycetaceae bacterium]
MKSVRLSDRVRGCLLGGALGDALGARYEGRPEAEFVIPPQLDLTDDTQLTLATCAAINEAKAVEPEAIAAEMAGLFQRGGIAGLGSSTLKALTELAAGMHWALAGAVGEYAAGNGAAMRIAPLAFLLDPEDERQRRVIYDVCQITHRHEEAYVGALLVVRVLRRLLAGEPLDRPLLHAAAERLPDSRTRDRMREAMRLKTSEYVSRFGGGGYVVDSVPLALLHAADSTSFLSTIKDIVRGGGDTDTIGSICGQMIGTAAGSKAVPQHLIPLLTDEQWVLHTIDRFVETCCDD